MLHEKLFCYQKAMEVAKGLSQEMSYWPKGYGYLTDQIKRAISSCVLNISEGNTRVYPKERRRFFNTARGSIAEVSSGIDLAHVFRLISEAKAINYKNLCTEISKMLFVLR